MDFLNQMIGEMFNGVNLVAGEFACGGFCDVKYE